MSLIPTHPSPRSLNGNQRLRGGVLVSLGVLLLQGLLHSQIIRPEIAPPGLWVGEVRLTHASQVNASGEPTPTADSASYRILIHVDPTGVTTLLKDVTLATVATTNNGVRVLRQVLLTDDKLASFRPESANGKPLVQRFGTVAYDWEPGTLTTNTFRMLGSLGAKNSCRATFTAPATSATNPFRHHKHPSHIHGATLERTLILQFGQQPTHNPSELSLNSLSGNIEDVIVLRPSGDASRLAVSAWGTINITRIASLSQLDPTP